MDKFLERFKPKPSDKNKKSNSGGGGGLNFSFPFPGQNNNKFQGQGQSLGGSKPGKVMEVVLDEPGPLGIRVEKRPMGSAIVADVIAGSQAERAGLLRGDILCFQGSNGQEEITYNMFLDLAKSDQRPLCLEIRRIKIKSSVSAPDDGKSRSAEAYARQQAVIAAAEKREREAKARNKTSKSSSAADGKNHSNLLLSTEERRRIEEERIARMNAAIENQSEASKEAVEAAKRNEASTAAQLGYNPYETNRVTGGQARTATTAVAHGTIQNATSNSRSSTSTSSSFSSNDTPSLPPVRSPSDPATNNSGNATSRNTFATPVSSDFESAYETVVTNNQHSTVVNSFSILRKLIHNAITKGQGEDETQASKFRRVRLANEKIKAAIVDVEGAFDLMVAVGFQLNEKDEEMFLVFPKDFPGENWIGTALAIMEKYEKS